MASKQEQTFVPILTVLPECGNAPFLWIARTPDVGVGPNLVDSSYWHVSYPLSEGLWRKFADWAIAFEHATLTSNVADLADWDWIAFNRRGLHLTRWLKEDVGDAYRVIYWKPHEDPNSAIDERTEFFSDGTQLVLRPACDSSWTRTMFCRHIVSGGQTGADRAALDFAIENGYTHGGWAPSERKAEDGPIRLMYQLTVLPNGSYRQRTKRNVEDSDGTLIVNLGELDGGTLATRQFAESLGKPHLVVQLDGGVSTEASRLAVQWLRDQSISTLNVAGPRESKRPGIYGLTAALLAAMQSQLTA